MHYCAYHKIEHPEEDFKIKPNGQLDSWCLEARRAYSKAYSRQKYAPIKEANKIKRENYKEPKSKQCTKCNQVKSIEEFPFRNDRPGKRHARCLDCLREERKIKNYEYNRDNFEKIRKQKREYRKTHPYNDASIKRRQERFKQTRLESGVDINSVIDKYGSTCYLCHKPIDLALKYPHPLSPSRDHIHPVIKRGPDSIYNIRPAHLHCNGRKKDKYTSVFSQGWEVKPISSQLARQIAKDYHYLHRAQNVSYAFGLFEDGNDDPYGFVSFGSPSSNRISKSVCPDDVKLVIELNRLFMKNETPACGASWLIARALKALPPYIVITYADSAIDDSRDLIRPHRHDGRIYRALNFNYSGCSIPSFEYRLPGSSRSVRKHTVGAITCEVSSKYRYWITTGTRRDKKLLSNLCRWSIIPYPEESAAAHYINDDIQPEPKAP